MAGFTAYGLEIGPKAFGDRNRYIKQYGLPSGRKLLSTSSLERQYDVVHVLDAGPANGGVGGLNEGIDLVEKKSRKGQLRVLKRIRVRPRERGALKREIEILHVLKHPNIIAFVDGYIPANDNGQAQLLVEFCDRGTLQDMIVNYIKYNERHPHHMGNYLPEAFLWQVFESLASALAYIHYGVAANDLRNPPEPKHPKEWPMILHRDIKPENIFLKSAKPRFAQVLPNPRQTSTAYPQVVLADFVSPHSSLLRT